MRHHWKRTSLPNGFAELVTGTLLTAKGQLAVTEGRGTEKLPEREVNTKESRAERWKETDNII